MPVLLPNTERLRRLRTLVGELGALSLVWLGDATGLQSYALPATLVVIGIDGLRRWRAHIGFPAIWFVFNSMALGFGVLTLTIARWLSPEDFGALCAFLLGFVFLVGSLTRISLIQALAEQRQDASFRNETPLLGSFFRLYTRVWAGFFMLRGFYLLYLGAHAHDAFTAGIVLKTSLVVMILLSFRGRTLYGFYAACRGHHSIQAEQS